MRFLIIFAIFVVVSRAAPVEEPSAAAEAAAGELVQAVEQDVEQAIKDEVLVTTTAPIQDQAMKEEDEKKEEEVEKKEGEEMQQQEEEKNTEDEEETKELNEITELLAQLVILEKLNNFFDRLDSFLP